MKKGIGSTEIARLAGVSRSTVSRVINGYKNVPQETHDKVMSVIEKYKYVPNHSAQVLKGKPTKTLGLFWIAHGRIAEDFLAEYIIVNIIENAAALGYHVLSTVLPNLSEKQNLKNAHELFLQRRIDGGIFIGLNEREQFVEDLADEGFVLGLFDYKPLDNAEDELRVFANFDSKTAEKSVDYLFSLGHRDIGIINGDQKRFSGVQKCEGFFEGFRKNKLVANPSWIANNGFSLESGREAMKAIISNSPSMPTAICCANDSIAFGAISALTEAGYKVPEDISVIGIDDHMRSSMLDPSLTTFRIDFDAMLSHLTEGVIQTLRGQSKGSLREFSGLLVERSSCRQV